MSLAPAVPHVRVDNAIFASYPWSTESICRVVDLLTLLGHDSPVYALASKLMELELRNISAVRDDQYSLFVEQMRGRPVTCASPDQAMESLYKTLMAYRLVDLELSHRGAALRVISPGPVLPVVSKHTKTPFEDLNDLQKIIKRSRKDLAARDKAIAKKTKTTTSTMPQLMASSNPLMTLYAQFAKSMHKSRLTHTVINLSSAALHLAYLLRGNVYLPSETHLIEDFITSSSTANDDHDLMEHIRSEYSTGTQGCSTIMHKTLFLALAVSPLMLLLPRSYDQFIGKAAILQSWSQFGSIVRPASVVAADTAIWKVLFAATKGGDVLTELRVALSDLDPVLGGASSAWFTLTKDKTLLQAPAASTSRVVDVDSESEDGPSSLVQGLNATAGTTLSPPIDNASSQSGYSKALLPLPELPHLSLDFDATSRTITIGSPLASAMSASPDADTSPIQRHASPSPSPSPVPVDKQPLSPAPAMNASPDADMSSILTPAPPSRSPSPVLADKQPLSPASAMSASPDADMSSILTPAPPSRSPSPVLADKQPLPSNKPVTRGSKKGKLSAPNTSYSSGPSKPRKRRSKKLKKETTPGIPNVRRKPTFIDLTLEDSDNEISDHRLNVNTDTGFITGDVEVSYRRAGSSLPYTWMPKFHLPTDIKWFYDLDSAVRRSAARPPPIKEITHSEYVSLGPAEVMDILRSHACIVVVDQPHIDTGFTEATFSEFCRLDEVTTIHDFSIAKGPRTRKGSVLDLLNASRLPNPPALSALHLPSAYDMYPNLPFSSDWAVWRQVQGEAYCRYTELYPVPHMRWAIAATGSANHFWHFDANGLQTFLRVETGIKFWYIAVPKDGDFRVFMQPEVMTKFELDESNEDLWDVYVLVLHPGTFLIMRPSLPHCVVTPEPAICSGGHVLAVATIPDSVVGAYHHFIGATSYTNTDHFYASHSVLMRLLVYYQLKLFTNTPEKSPHMPDLSTWDGFLVIFYLCVYFELVSALASWDYSNNTRGFAASIKNRSRARNLLYQVFSRYKFVGPAGTSTGIDAFHLIYSEFLAHHARLLVHYKELAVKRNVKGVDTSTSVSSVAEAVSDCIRGGPASSIYANVAPGDAPGSFAWNGPTYVIQLNSEPVEFDFPYWHGYVYGDIKAAESLGLNIDDVFLNVLLAADKPSEADDDDGDNNSSDNDSSNDRGDDYENGVELNEQVDDAEQVHDDERNDDDDGHGGVNDDRSDDSNEKDELDEDEDGDGGVDDGRSKDSDDEEESDEDARDIRSSRRQESQKRARSSSGTQEVSTRKKARPNTDSVSRT